LAIFRRIPTWGQVAPVYALIVLMIYSWTMIWFFWKLPSLIDFLNIGEILSVLTYPLATNLIESLLVLCAPLLLSVILPQKWFHDVFVARGAALVLAGLLYAIFLAFQFQTINGYPDAVLNIWSLALAAGIIGLIVFVVGRTPLLRKGIEALADRSTIFLYITIPLSVIALLLILIRLVA
jgi:hypothetical protein